MTEKRHRKHLKSRKSKAFNTESKHQEDVANEASRIVWDTIVKKYPELKFNNLQTLGLKTLDAHFALEYLNRGLHKEKLPERIGADLQAFNDADGIKPDGGVFFVQSKSGDFNHIIGVLEVKHQGEYDGYTPISNSDWKKKKGDPSIAQPDRPPQAQGNAIERFAKNANAIKTLTSFYGYNPYLVMCEGFDFFLKEDYPIFEHQHYASRFKDKDSSILMRLVAGNDWLPLNKIFVECFEHGDTRICPATIFAHMPKWSAEEVAHIMLTVIDKSITHLKKIREI